MEVIKGLDRLDAFLKTQFWEFFAKSGLAGFRNQLSQFCRLAPFKVRFGGNILYNVVNLPSNCHDVWRFVWFGFDFFFLRVCEKKSAKPRKIN